MTARSELSHSNPGMVRMLRSFTLNAANRIRIGSIEFEREDFEEFDSDQDEDDEGNLGAVAYWDADFTERWGRDGAWFAKWRRKEEFITAIAAQHHNQNVKVFIGVSLICGVSYLPIYMKGRCLLERMLQ